MKSRVVKKRYFNKVSVLLSAVILLTACGNASDKDTPAPDLQAAGYDWKAEGFKTGSGLEEGLLFTIAYDKIECTKPLGSIGADYNQAVYGNIFYILDQYYTSQDTICNFWKINTDTQDSEKLALTSDQWGIPKGNILGMDVAADQFVFWVASDYVKEKGGRFTAGHYYIVYTDAQGNQLKSMDIIETLRSNGIWENQPNAYAGTTICCDSEGNLYLCDEEKRAVYLLDQEGLVKSSYTCSPATEMDVFKSIRTSDGEVIFVFGNFDTLDFIWLEPETGMAKQLATVTEMGNILKWYGLYGDTIYCASKKQLIGWNVSTGERKILLDLEENAIGRVANTSLLVNGESIKLLTMEADKRYVLTLSAEEPIMSGEITFVNICGENSYLAGRAASFSRENPTFGINYQVEENKERVLMEMMTGAGPDILYVSSEDLDHLQANGVLGDMKQLLSKETQDMLLPGALEMGSYGGELLGLPVSVSVRSLVTSRKYWQGTAWSLEDVLSILKEHEELSGLFTDGFGQDNYYYNMYFLVGMDLEHSSLIVNGEGKFDSLIFKEIMFWVKKKTNNKSGFGYAGPVTEAVAKALREGEYLGIEFFVSSMANFGSYLARMGEDFQPTGYPTETGRGHYMQSSDGGMIVVNQAAIEKAGIGELVEYLFSLEGQQYIGEYSISVRMDIPESQLMYMEEQGQYFWVFPNGNMILLPDKYDGTSYLDEYVEFLKNAVPYPVYSDELFNIIMEEADGYFTSGKSLDEVTEVIQRRIQVNLDEKK